MSYGRLLACGAVSLLASAMLGCHFQETIVIHGSHVPAYAAESNCDTCCSASWSDHPFGYLWEGYCTPAACDGCGCWNHCALHRHQTCGHCRHVRHAPRTACRCGTSYGKEEEEQQPLPPDLEPPLADVDLAPPAVPEGPENGEPITEEPVTEEDSDASLPDEDETSEPVSPKNVIPGNSEAPQSTTPKPQSSRRTHTRTKTKST